MAHILFEHVNVDFPIYNAKNRSLKNKVMQAATGGKVSFGAEGTVIRSLEDVSFEIKEGERVGLVGHNGAGKSTLLRALSNVYAPTAGKAEIRGEIGSLVDIGLGIDGEATGRENIFIRGALLGLRRKEIERQFDEIVGEIVNAHGLAHVDGCATHLALVQDEASHLDAGTCLYAYHLFAHKAALVHVAGHAAGGVAAHLGLCTVGVEHAHAHISPVGGLHDHKAVGAYAEVAVGNPLRKSRGIVHVFGKAVDVHVVVAAALHLGKFDGFHAFLLHGRTKSPGQKPFFRECSDLSR